MKPIAIFGGAFNPITLGHLAIATEIERLGFSVLFMPCGERHSFAKHMLAVEHRLELLACAVGPERITRIEIEHRTFRAADTYPLLVERYGRVHWIIGSDNANSIHRWADGERLRTTIPFIVYNRPGHPLAETGAWCLQEPHHYVDLGDIREISSTQVRSAIARGDWGTARRLLPETAYALIRAQNWYQAAPAAIAGSIASPVSSHTED